MTPPCATPAGAGAAGCRVPSITTHTRRNGCLTLGPHARAAAAAGTGNPQRPSRAGCGSREARNQQHWHGPSHTHICRRACCRCSSRGRGGLDAGHQAPPTEKRVRHSVISTLLGRRRRRFHARRLTVPSNCQQPAGPPFTRHDIHMEASTAVLTDERAVATGAPAWAGAARGSTWATCAGRPDRVWGGGRASAGRGQGVKERHEQLKTWAGGAGACR